MGLTQSQTAFFYDASQVDGDEIDVYEYLQSAERSLWREEPWWQQRSHQQFGDSTRDECVDPAAVDAATLLGSNEPVLASIESTKPLTLNEALAVIPKMMHDGWVAPLVALVESVDTVVQSVALALLSKIVKSASAETIFIRVGGIDKLIALLDSNVANVQYLALEVIYVLCARNAHIVLRFCKLGLVRRLATLTKSNAPPELTLAALKVLQLTLHQDAVKAEMAPCTMLTVLMERIASSHTAIAKASIICIGLALPNATNLAEIVRLGCIDAFLKLMTPMNPNADAVIYALMLIAHETHDVFPRDLTIATTLRMLETLRGAAKRSRTARAMGLFVAALATSPVFHAPLCTEASLSILSKLLVGGSSDVLCVSAFALGVIATHARDDAVKELLFRVDAPTHLMKLLVSPSSSALAASSSSAATREQVVRLAIFALACMLHDGVTLPASAPAVYPNMAFADSLRVRMLSCCDELRSSPALIELIYDCAILELSVGSTYAAKLLVCISDDDAIKRQCCNAQCVQRMLAYTRGASSAFLTTCLVFFIECMRPQERVAIAAQSDSIEHAAIATAAPTGEAFCACVVAPDSSTELNAHDLDAFVSLVVHLFETHAPEHLLGLPVLLHHCVACASVMKAALSVHSVVDCALAAVTRLNHVVLHDQVLRFLVALTQQKNDIALRVLFAADPERVANLLHSPCASIQLRAATLLRRMFKRLNALEFPSVATKRQLVKLIANSGSSSSSSAGRASVTGADALSTTTQRDVAVAAVRGWGNLFLYDDKRVSFATLPNALEALLLLLSACASDCRESVAAEASDETPTLSTSHSDTAVSLKHLHVAIRSVHRAVQSDDVKRAIVAAPHLLCVVDLFTHVDARVVHLAIETLTAIAQLSPLRKHIAVAAVFTVVHAILRDLTDATASSSHAVARIDALRLVSTLSKKDAWTQRLLLEYNIVDAAILLLHSPLAALDPQLLYQSLDTLAWTASGVDSPVRSGLATRKLVEFALRHMNAPHAPVVSAALHVLQRLSVEPAVQDMVHTANGPALIMRALNNCYDSDLMRCACALMRNLVIGHDANREQFQRLGANSYLVTLVASCTPGPRTLKLRVKTLHAIAAMAEGTSAIAMASKHELLECDDAHELVRLVSFTDDPRLCAAWCRALAMLAAASSTNQRKLVDAGGVVELLVQFVASCEHAPLRVAAAQLLAYLATAPENRTTIMRDGDDALLIAVIDALQSDVHDVQRFVTLLVANLATRNDANKVRLGASGVVAPLVDRLSSKQLNVVENVLSAVTKLGSHAGNKVKFGSKVAFEKLLALVHHDELAIRKRAVSAIAVLIERNDGNTKWLVECDARVVPELCALLRSANGKVVESAMLILGELAQRPDQTLAISQCIDVIVLVRLIEHVNSKIKRAALTTVMHLTKESFNKLRFGLGECIAALLASLQSDDLLVVERAISCLANLSFTAANAQLIAQTGALPVLLKLAAASTTAKDYLTWKEARALRLDKHSSSTGGGSDGTSLSPHKNARDSGDAVAAGIKLPQEDNADGDSVDDSAAAARVRNSDGDGNDDNDGEWSDSDERAVYADFGTDDPSTQVLDFSSFPSRQTCVLEQTLLVLSNCADECHAHALVEHVAIKVVCQTLLHPSELVKRCACYILAVWCKQGKAHQSTATAAGILPTLIQLLNSPTLSIVEAALYALGKLSYYSDNHVKMLQLDLLATLIQGLLRRASHNTHAGLLDRALRLLGTLATFAKVRHALAAEEVVADIVTPLLQQHTVALGKNASRLVLAMLEEESLKFFLPKPTVMLLRAVFTDVQTSAKTLRNVLRVFLVLARVEEHKTTIALEDSGEALSRMVNELSVIADVKENALRLPVRAPNAVTVLPLLANLAASKRIAVILVDKQLCAVLPTYLARYESRELGSDDKTFELPSAPAALSDVEQLRHLELNLHAVVVVKHLCVNQPDRAVAELSSIECTALLLSLLRTSVQLLPSRLTRLSFECLVVLEQLCVVGGDARNSSSTHDQHALFHDAAVNVFVANLELWLRVAVDGDRSTPPVNLGACEALDAVAPLAFIAPLVQLLHSMAAHTDNRNALVRAGATMLLLQAMSVPPLSRDLRICCAQTVAALTALPIAKDVLDSADHVAPLVRYLLTHEHDVALLLDSLCAFANIVELSPASRHYVLAHPRALAFLLECLADARSDKPGSAVHSAMRALASLSMEQAVAQSLASLASLPLVPRLLLLPFESMSRMTQLIATEIVGRMAFFGHVESLHLEAPMVARVLALAAFHTDTRVDAAPITVALWSVAQLATSTLLTRVCKWIVDDAAQLDMLVQYGLLLPRELGVPSTVVGHALTILLRIVDNEDVAAVLVRKHICTPLSALLETVESDIRNAALSLLALLLPRYVSVRCGADDDGDNGLSTSEQWPTILRHIVEWMEVYARDPVSCSIAALDDAYVCLRVVVTELPATTLIEHEVQTAMLRTGVAEIVANTLQHFDATTRVVLGDSTCTSAHGASGSNDTVKPLPANSVEQRILLHALKVALRLMELATAYCTKFEVFAVPLTLESVLHLDDAQLQLVTLACMNCMATAATVDTHSRLLFASDRCMTRFMQLANETPDLVLIARVTSLLARLATARPTLSGLSYLDTIDIITRLVHTHWTAQRSDLAQRVTDDGCTVLLALFTADASNVYRLFNETRVIAHLFAIVETFDAPELPLRVLAAIAQYAPSHAAFVELLPALCRLLSGSNVDQLGSASHSHVLTILSNVFCCDDADSGSGSGSGISEAATVGSDTATQRIELLAAGAHTVLPQVLPLARWVRVAHTQSVAIVLQLLLAFVAAPKYRTLLNDGANTVALLELVDADSADVAVEAANVLLRVSNEREVQISITVEDGVGTLVQTLQRTRDWLLQCRILTILRTMSTDSEVQVLVLQANGAARLVQFVDERSSVHFAADTRLALACDVLRQLSYAPSAASSIVASRGHASMIELNALQLGSSDSVGDDECVVTLETLANLARAVDGAPQLVSAKLHELFLTYMLPHGAVAAVASDGASNSASEPSRCAQLALAGLRSLCRVNHDVRRTLGAKSELVSLLETHLVTPLKRSTTSAESTITTTTAVAAMSSDSLMLLQLLSTTHEGRASIVAASSVYFLERVCSVVSRESRATTAAADDSSNKRSQVTTSTTASTPLSAVVVAGTKLLANLLDNDDNASPEHVNWQFAPLVSLAPLLAHCVANHQQLKRQLTALRVLRGAGTCSSSSFYFPLSPQMLSDVLNVLLINASSQHCALAEAVVVNAFRDSVRVRASIGGHQILEQLVIVVTQKTSAMERRDLGSALTEALYVSVAYAFVVDERFLSKLLTLLASLSNRSNSDCDTVGNGDDDSATSRLATTAPEDAPLVRALCVYVSFMFTSASTLQRMICDVLRSEANADAFRSIVSQVADVHAAMCRRAHPELSKADTEVTSNDGSLTVAATTGDEHLPLWRLFAECVGPPVPHVERILEAVGLAQWLCLVNDFFAFATALEASASASSGTRVESVAIVAPNGLNGVDGSSVNAAQSRALSTDSAIASPSAAAVHVGLTYDDAVLATLKVTSVLTKLSSTTDAQPSGATNATADELQHGKDQAATSCLKVLWPATTSLDCRAASVEAALATLLDIRDGWGERCLLDACRSFESMAPLLAQLLEVFHVPSHTLDWSRHLLLQFLLTLASTGTCVDELKASAIQRAIEHNALIAAADKALPLTILSLLGCSEDLTNDFARALDRCITSSSAEHTDDVAYVVHFLQHYAVTDDLLQQRAISVFMRELVAATDASMANAVVSSNDDDAAHASVAMTATRVQLSVAGLVQLAAARKFAELFLRDQSLNVLLSVVFARRRGDATNNFQDCAALPLDVISQLLTIAAHICSWLGASSALVQNVDERDIVHALLLVQSLERANLALIEQVLALLAWLLDDATCFAHVCRHTALLAAFLPWLLEYSDSAVALLLRVLDMCVRYALRTDALDALLLALLEFVYTRAAALSTCAAVRDKLLLFVLLLLKRLGDEGRAGSDVYEHALQRVLANIRAPTAAQARISWSLLGMLTEFDAAIVAIGNLDGIAMLLCELCVRNDNVVAPLSAAARAVNPHGAFQMEALKCLSKAARTHDDVLFKIGATDGIAATLFTVLANAAAMLAVAHSDTNTNNEGSSSDETQSAVASADIGDAQEHAAHLIARLAAQETLRATLLSPDNVAVLIEALESVHLGVVLTALEALYHLCDVALCLDALVRHATVPVLAQILSSPLADAGSATQQSTETFVLGILGTMCAAHARIGRRVVSSNLVPKLSAYLRSPREVVQHSVTQIVHSLSRDRELVPKLRDAGVLETLARALSTYDPRATQSYALGAIAKMLTLGSGPLVSADAALANAVVTATIEAIEGGVPLEYAQSAVAEGLRVLAAFAAMMDSAAKALLLDTGAVQLALSLLGATDASVRLAALQVATTYVDRSDVVDDDAAPLCELFDDAVLLHVVRTVAEPSSQPNELLLVALALLHALLQADDMLKDKLTAMAYELLLRLVATYATPSPTAGQTKALAAALQCLTTMAAASGSHVALSTAAEIVHSIEPLIVLLRSAASDAIRVDALHLLVNFAAAVELRGAMLRGGMLTALVAMLRAAVNRQDSEVVQLCLLGMALLTAVDFSNHVADVAGANVATLVELLGSRHPHIQANAVWVLSNISTEGSLRNAIVALGGATTLQTLLNEATAPHDGSTAATARSAAGSAADGGSSTRPTSSSMRIREYAPKAIRSLGFAP